MSSSKYAFAHRGGRAHGADNTLDTFREALTRGASGLETDAWLTADGVVVLDHDGVHRAARRRQTPLGDVRRELLPAHIPSLDELYDACGTAYDLAIDVRLPRVGDAIVEVARRHDALDRLWLVTGSPDHLATWRASSGQVRLAVSIRLRERRTATVEEARAAGADAVNLRWPWWSRRLVARVHGLGLLAFGYDVQSRWASRRCARLGLDGIFSDHVSRLSTNLGP